MLEEACDGYEQSQQFEKLWKEFMDVAQFPINDIEKKLRATSLFAKSCYIAGFVYAVGIEKCSECDGRGTFGELSDPVECLKCGGTGYIYPTPSALKDAAEMPGIIRGDLELVIELFQKEPPDNAFERMVDRIMKWLVSTLPPTNSGV